MTVQAQGVPAFVPSDIERETIRRVIRRLIPFLALLFIVNFLDRTNVGFAALRMNAEIGLSQSLYGLGAGVWSRDINTCYRMGRGIKAGRVWTNCYHAYPAHAAFGGYKQSGIGRENHKMMLEHYQQTKNLLVSYSPKALGFF